MKAPSREQIEKKEDEMTLHTLEAMDNNWEGAKTIYRELRKRKRVVMEPETNGRV